MNKRTKAGKALQHFWEHKAMLENNQATALINTRAFIDNLRNHVLGTHGKELTKIMSAESMLTDKLELLIGEVRTQRQN